MNDMIPHTEHGRFPCACDIPEVTVVEQEFLNRFDNWYGDKAYRQHEDALKMVAHLVERLENQRSVIRGLQGQILELARENQR